MNFADVRLCLEKDGWPVDPVSETTLRSRFRGQSRIFPLFVHFERSHAIFAVIPFTHVPREAEESDPMVTRLLELNRDMNMAKFSIDEDDDVVLSVEYPLADLDPSEVRDAVDVLSFYADKYFAEVAKLAGEELPTS